MTAESSSVQSNENKESETKDSEPTTNSDETPDTADSKTQEKSSVKPSENAQSEDAEDVPQDFFDDFSNPDFMEGLNIVDAWDDEPEDDSKEDTAKKSSGLEDKKRSPENRRARRKRCLERRRRSRSRDRHRESKDKNLKRSSSPKKEKSKSESDLRRDPAKTKRDIENYKVRCDKDKEQKTITDKLKVVETGLVPPGMEMDVDVDEVMKQAKKIEKAKCPELDDQWQSNPSDVSSKVVYPDLKPSAVLPEKDLKKKSHHQSRSKEKSVKSLGCEPIGNSPLNSDSERERRESPGRERRKSPERDRRKSSERERRKSPERARERRRRSSSGERDHRRSHGERRRRLSPDIRRSPLTHKRRSLERRSPSRERGRDRLRRAVRSRSRDRRSSSRGRRRRSRSLSEREAWIRDPKRAWRSSRSRSRSRSPKRKRHDDKKEKKISFLEEIHQLLTGTKQTPPSGSQHQLHPSHVAQPHHTMMGSASNLGPGPVSIPLPVPPPVNRSFGFPGPTQPVPHPNVQFDMYDQQFFIGNSSGTNPIMPGPHPVNANQPIPITGPQGIIPGVPVLSDPKPRHVPITGTKQFQNTNNVNISTSSPVKQNTVMNKPEPLKQTPLEKSLADLKNSIGLASSDKMAKEVKAAAKEELKKLYEEKKITLSDFLSMTSKLEDVSSSSANLTKKIQVISRCQEVVKQLGEGKVTSGRLILPRTIKEKTPEAESMSPLLRKPLIYKSTTPQEVLKETFTKKLNKLLVSSGVTCDDILIGNEDEKEERVSLPAAPAPPFIPKARTSVTSMEPSRFLVKMVQTDPVKCKECEERNDIIYIHSASQCSVSVRSIGIQATEDPIKEILKNKPLAALTPAQLLMKEKEKERCLINEERRLGYPGNHDFGLDRIMNFRDGRSPPRIHFSPPRTHYSPPRGPFDPPRRLVSPPSLERAGPYVPSGPLKKDPLLPKRPLYPPQDYMFDDDPNRYFRR